MEIWSLNEWDHSRFYVYLCKLYSLEDGISGGSQAGAPNTGGATQVQTGVQAWVQGAIAKINSGGTTNTDSTSATITSTAISGPTQNLPLSVSTATFPGTPAVRLISDCHFLHRLCQLLLFCLIFRKRQLPRFVNVAGARPVTAPDGTSKLGLVKEDPLGGQRTANGAPIKSEDGSQATVRTASTVSKGGEDVTNPRLTRVGNGNCGQGYTADEVRIIPGSKPFITGSLSPQLSKRPNLGLSMHTTVNWSYTLPF